MIPQPICLPINVISRIKGLQFESPFLLINFNGLKPRSFKKQNYLQLDSIEIIVQSEYHLQLLQF